MSIKELLKSIYDRKHNDCNCSDLADFTEISPYGDSTKYKCNGCNRSYYSPQYIGSTCRVNPTMKKWHVNQAIRRFTDTMTKVKKDK